MADKDTEFDIVGIAPIPHQRTLRPERPIESLSDYVHFLEELEEVFGPIPRPARPLGGAVFLL